MRTAARTDANQTEIVNAFRKLGWSVLIISQLKNCCDIIVSKNGRTVAIEIKDGKKPKHQQKLTSGELKFKSEWQGEYKIVNCIGDAVKLTRIKSTSRTCDILV